MYASVRVCVCVFGFFFLRTNVRKLNHSVIKLKMFTYFLNALSNFLHLYVWCYFFITNVWLGVCTYVCVCVAAALVVFGHFPYRLLLMLFEFFPKFSSSSSCCVDDQSHSLNVPARVARAAREDTNTFEHTYMYIQQVSALSKKS